MNPKTLRLVNRYEEIAHRELMLAAERFSLSVFPKVRVADVVDPDRFGIVGDLKSYALKAHFDFLVCRDQYDAAYAIEFDGAYHATPTQRARDEKKNELCRAAGLPILRINSNHLSKDFGRQSLLGWLIDVAEMQREFDAEQEAGRIPCDEGFDPMNLMSSSPGEARFPYWISARAAVSLERLHRAKKIDHPMASGFFGRDERKVYHGMQLIAVTDEAGVFVQTAMRPQQFPAPFGELLSEILTVQIADRVAACLAGKVPPVPMADIYARARTLRNTLRLGGATSYGPVTDAWTTDGF